MHSLSHQDKPRTGRPTRLTAEVSRAFCECIRAGTLRGSGGLRGPYSRQRIGRGNRCALRTWRRRLPGGDRNSASRRMRRGGLNPGRSGMTLCGGRPGGWTASTGGSVSLPGPGKMTRRRIRDLGRLPAARTCDTWRHFPVRWQMFQIGTFASGTDRYTTKALLDVDGVIERAVLGQHDRLCSGRVTAAFSVLHIGGFWDWYKKRG